MGALADALFSKGGYSRIDAENAERGPRSAELSREFLGSGSSGGSSSGGGGTDFAALAQQQLELKKQANQPAISSLEASIPETQAAYSTLKTSAEGRRDPLTQRYDALLNSLVGEQSTATSREFGRRGIPLSSGLFDQTLLEQTQPIRQSVGAEKNAALQSLDEYIAQLGLGEIADTRSIRNSIAQLMAGGSSEAINSALQLYQLQQQQGQFDATASKPKTETITANGRKYLVTYGPSGNVLSKTDLGASSEGSSGGGLNALAKELNRIFPGGLTGNAPTAPKGSAPAYTPSSGLGTKNNGYVYTANGWVAEGERPPLNNFVIQP